MKALLALMFATTAAFAMGQPQTRIDGNTYGTGYLGSKHEGAKNWQPEKKFMDEVPEAYDSREFGFVTPIKDQRQCGSCWAFSRTKALEAAWIVAEGIDRPIDLAEQDTVANDHGSYGCSGGFMSGKFETEVGLTTEDLCPYTANSRACHGAKFAHSLSWGFIGDGDSRPTVDELKAAIYKYKVLSVVVAAGGSFHPNSEGRILTCGGQSINHMVTLAGYRPTADGGVEFLIGNSWSESWGDKGFAWSKAGCNALAREAMYFTLLEGGK